ncbi:MAG: hypothetical protein HZA50_08560 [Planctomycetes bacterium]|nr:hypothetical protein [Planctomycetota bacterium]
MPLKNFAMPVVAGLIAAVCGCVPTRQADAPGQAVRDPRTGNVYIRYVPRNYTKDRAWPMVVILHGTYGFDPPEWQIQEWQALAEEKGLIVVAPRLKSVQGVIKVNKVVRPLWLEDLAEDEKIILGMLDDMQANYNIDPAAILLTGFSSGGYPLYYVGLRNPDRFNMIIPQACNFDAASLETTQIPPQAKKMNMVIIWGKDDQFTRDESWAAFRWLREHGFDYRYTDKKITDGGHRRQPELVYELWLKKLPQQYHVQQ